MGAIRWRATRLTWAVAVLGTAWPACAQEAEGVDKPAPKSGSKIVEIGAEDAQEVGKLPALTNELASRGAAAISKRDWKAAREIYTEMVEAEPDNALALANLGSVEYQLKDFDAAVEHLGKAVRQRPNLAQTWLTLGMVHYQRDEQLLALSAVSRAVAEKPDDPRSHNYLAAITKALGWLGASEAELQKALDLDPAYAEAHFNLALLYLERRPPATELANRHYLKAIELGSPRDSLVEKQLNEAESGESNKESAAKPAEDTPSKDPGAGKPAGKGGSSSGTKPASSKKSSPARKPKS